MGGGAFCSHLQTGASYKLPLADETPWPETGRKTRREILWKNPFDMWTPWTVTRVTALPEHFVCPSFGTDRLSSIRILSPLLSRCCFDACVHSSGSRTGRFS